MFRFLPAEIAQMEATERELTDSLFPTSEAIDELTAKFNASPERAGKVAVKPKQVLTWFHNHRYAPRTKEKKARRAAEMGKTVLPASKLHRASSSSTAPSVQDGALLGNRRMDSGQFMGEIMPPWTQVRRCSTPFQPAECVDVHCYDQVLCLQEGPELSLHFDASVRAIQRTTHDSSECQCKFLVLFEHDKTEVIVPLSKLRRPPPPANRYRLPSIYQASRLETSANCHVQPTKAIVVLTPREESTGAEKEDPTKTIAALTPNENSTGAQKKEEPALVDLTSNENSTRAEKEELRQFKLMGVTMYESTMASSSEIEKPADNSVDAF